MLLHITTLTLLVLCEVKSDFVSESTWMDMKNGRINNVVEYCKNKNCLVKCCPNNQSIVKITRKPANYSCYPIKVDYSEFNKYITWDVALSKSNVSYFHFIQNDRLADLNKKSKPYSKTSFKLLKDGSMKFNESDLIRKFTFCVDFYIAKRKAQRRLIFKLEFDSEIPDAEAKNLFIVAGMLISSFFMILVLVVYALLPNLQNIVGKVLMAYLLTLGIGYTVRAAQLIVITYPYNALFSCSDSSPAYYFFMIASFFWLNIMSLDLWWTLRGQRKCRDIHRRGEHVKFFWYCAYAWGTPLLITLLVLIVEKQKLYIDEYKPPFQNCFAEDFSIRIYVHLPIAIMTFANFVLFSMTVYNIWLIKRSVVNNNDSRNTQRHQNRFAIYTKLFILMGVTWVFELISTHDWVWHILLNSVTIPSGVFIFYMFVCKKKIIVMLCKRLNIQNRFVDRLRPSNNSCTETSKSSQTRSRRSQKSSLRSLELTTLSTDI